MRSVAKRLASQMRSDPKCHHARLNALDPHMTFKSTSRLPRRSQTLLHRLRLGVAFTRHCMHRIKRGDPPSRNPHLIYHSAIFAVDREDLQMTVESLDNGPSSCDNVLGSWQCTEHSVRATKVLVQFLQDTGPTQSL
ncbi:hypothetical protein HPB47_020552 [Ixodes persulcatus]|uniref:Uncharacterized protein n=1 Tax=Ixodes persulcatus TaxID=34615 RepID=A0AC60QF69_IXOPE|nr:hypothetical protein HPB47_020552 [Ixodes persulcatus]